MQFHKFSLPDFLIGRRSESCLQICMSKMDTPKEASSLLRVADNLISILSNRKTPERFPHLNFWRVVEVVESYGFQPSVKSASPEKKIREKF
mmetsp:Transcript_33259/g.51011  ORF Transcript_33259/g.51011 Transcript_33259/m.51011 type:complete len:92 (-) Transcript_33259:1064-1339(-)